jgi:hypothetical protein
MLASQRCTGQGFISSLFTRGGAGAAGASASASLTGAGFGRGFARRAGFGALAATAGSSSGVALTLSVSSLRLSFVRASISTDLPGSSSTIVGGRS